MLVLFELALVLVLVLLLRVWTACWRSFVVEPPPPTTTQHNNNNIVLTRGVEEARQGKVEGRPLGPRVEGVVGARAQRRGVAGGGEGHDHVQAGVAGGAFVLLLVVLV